MKLTQTNLINNFSKLCLIDLLLLLSYVYYQPLCEPCLEKNDCEPCISEEQYFIIYLGIVLNLLFVILYKRKEVKKS